MRCFMKNLLVAFLGVIILISATACSDDTVVVKTDTGETISVLSAKSIAKQNDKYLETVDSYYDDDYNYYIFDLGMLQDIPLEESNQFFKYSGGNVTYKFTNTESSSVSIQTCSENTATKSTYWENNQEIGAEVNFGKKDVWNVALSAKFNFKQGGLDTTTWSETFSKCEEFSKTSQQEVTIVFDDSCPHGYYRYLLAGAVNVYAVVIQDRNTSKLYTTTYTTLRSYGYVMDFDEKSSVFDNYDDSRLTFDLSGISNLPAPNKKVPLLALKTLVVYDSTLQSDEYKITGSGKSITKEIAFSKSIETLQHEGYTSINICIDYDLKEYDDCYQTISVYNPHFTFYEEEFSHGGFTGYTGGVFLQYNNATTAWGTYHINNTFDINNFSDNKIYFKAQAENAIYRDFSVKQVKVKITAIKDLKLS